eukprot:6549431-Prymnesium_polylepis.1
MDCASLVRDAVAVSRQCLRRVHLLLHIHQPDANPTATFASAFAGLKTVEAIGLEHVFRKLGNPLSAAEVRAMLLAHVAETNGTSELHAL